MEEARGYRALMDDFGLTQESVSISVGKSRPAVANALRLLSLQPEIVEFLEKGALSSGHARALLPLEDKCLQLDAAKRIVEKGLSVRQAETLVAALQKSDKSEKPSAQTAVDYASVMVWLTTGCAARV